MQGEREGRGRTDGFVEACQQRGAGVRGVRDPGGEVVTGANRVAVGQTHLLREPLERVLVGGPDLRPGQSEPVGDPATLFARLRAAGRVALGVDLPLGIPRAYASAHVEAADFTAFLRGLAARPEFFAVCGDLDEVAPGRPFYPARGVAGMTRAAHAQRLGFASALDLSRLCDRDMIVPALNGDAPPALWPFMGDFKALLAEHEIVLAETYPAEVMRHLGLSTRGSKRRQTDRIALAEALLGAMTALGCHPDDAMKTSLLNGFGADAAGEDRFDATIGVLGVINVLEGRRPDGIPDDPGLRRWEGWVLGQTDLPGARP